MANLIGTGLNQVPTNGLLGNMAFQNKEAVSMDLLGVSGNASFLGDVGIGTASPGVKLDVIGTIRSKNAAGDVGGLRFWSDVSGNGNIFEYFNASLIFGTGDTERMRINASGNVGIGATPSAWGANYKGIEGYGNATFFLAGNSVNGITTIGNSFHNGTNWVYTTAGAASRYQVGTTAAPHIWSYAASGSAGATLTWTEGMRLDISGNVGIGIAAPDSRLHLHSTAGGGDLPRLRFTNGGTGTTATDGMFIGISNSTQLDVWNFESDAVRFATTNTERMRITAGGNVGIGTTSTTRLLTIGNSTGARYATINGGNTNAGDGGALLFEPGGTFLHAIGNFSSILGSVYSDTFVIYNKANSPMLFYTNDTERLRITNTGDLGIGTTTTSSWRTRITAAGTQALSLQNSSSTGTRLQFLDTSWGAEIEHNNGAMILKIGGTTEAMRITSGGLVGIGTSSPDAKLTVASGLDAIYNSNILVTSTAATAKLAFNPNGVGSAAVGAASSGLLFYTNGANTERARIDSNGNFLVGTTNLVTASQAGVRVGPTGFIEISRGSGTTSWDVMSFINGNSTVGTINTNGTATSYNTSSDYRLKEIDGPIVSSGAYIDALKPVQGSWKADGSRFIGLLAHEVQEVSETQIATGEKDGEEMQAMDYSAPEIIANLIAELQSLRTRVAELERK